MTIMLQDWVSRAAAQRPSATAVVLGNERLTYAGLEQASNRLARVLQEAGCRKGDRICFLIPKSPIAIVTMIGAMKAGCTHVPLDTASPAARVRKIIDACDCRWLLAAGPVTGLLDELMDDPALRARLSIGWLDPGNDKVTRWQGDRVTDRGREVPSCVQEGHPRQAEGPIAEDRGEAAVTLSPCHPATLSFPAGFTREDVDRASDDPVPQQTKAYDPAHLLFTSGSTGTPKGVVITHANVIHFIEWAVRHFCIDSSDRLSGHAPLHFDLSTFDIFGAFAAGAELHLVGRDLALIPPRLVEFIRASELTQWFSVPSVLSYLAHFDAVKPNDFPHLRRVLWCGEVLPTPSLIYWMQRLPHVRFANLYGPTEATIASSCYDVPVCPEDEKSPIPIGTACYGEELLVLDKKLERVGTNVVGDLYIRGAGLSPGYWRDPEKTAAAFLPNPYRDSSDDRIYRTGDLARIDENGLAHFLGRADTQIKSRGYRIELGEIETALHALKCTQECAVVAVPSDGFEGWVICCAYVPRPESPISPARLRKDLSRLIPGYMLPGRWKPYDALPKNANGKIDRPRLKEQFSTLPSVAALGS